VANPIFMFRIDIGFDPERGYAAVLSDVRGERVKGVKGNSIRNLMRNVSSQICTAEQQMRRFPLEHERSKIITPDGFSP
jgi:hypothetical protein